MMRSLLAGSGGGANHGDAKDKQQQANKRLRVSGHFTFLFFNRSKVLVCQGGGKAGKPDNPESARIHVSKMRASLSSWRAGGVSCRQREPQTVSF
jgi:hypothetical protein